MYDNLKTFLANKGLKVDDTKIAVKLAIIDYLNKAKIDNKLYLNMVNPTASDRNAQIAKLTRQMIRIEHILTNDLTAEE